jgi:ATP-dependent Lhr-like helicase
VGFEYLAEPVRSALAVAGITEPTPPQQIASPIIARGENVLVIAPTGSGKTEAAVLPLLSRLVREGHGEGISLLYITPLRALNRDMFRRLASWCARLGLSVDVRHGDTPSGRRSMQSRRPPDVLVTTPESLQAILPGKRMRSNLLALKAVVVDELHSIVESKRGTQLAVGLERLRRVNPGFQVVGLSATIGTREAAARLIFGNKRYSVAEARAPKEFSYSIEYPLPSQADSAVIREGFASPDLAARLTRISQLIEKHRSTLVFVNSRSVAEMLGEKLGRIRKDVGVHHGSLPREERERVEKEFRDGSIRALTCTSTLELGIDIGAVDLVIQYMSPRQVTALIQRVGRSGHSLGRISEGAVVAVSADDVLESAAAIIEARAGRIEPTRPYANCLDVLAHQIAGYLMDFGTMEASELLAEIRRAAPYEGLTEGAFWRTVKYMEELRKLRVEGTKLVKTWATRDYYYENLSMIPDETRYIVVDVTTGQTVGILGEEFVLLRAKVGVHFICKGRIWQVESISDDRKVYVTPVEDPLAAVPGWDGEMLPVPYELAQKVGSLRREIASAIAAGQEETKAVLDRLPADENAKSIVADQIAEQMKMGAAIPSDELILFEGFEKYLIVHMCLGEAVNRTFGYVFEEVLSRRGLLTRWWMDGYRLILELAKDTSEIDIGGIATELLGLSPEELEKTYAVAAQRNFPFPGRVKVIAERFGAIRRGKYISHPNLCSLPTRFERTPIFEEALQETGRDLIDIEKAKGVLRDVAEGRLRVATFRGERPTPIAYALLYRYLEVPEAVAPDSLGKTAYQRMKATVLSIRVEMVCMKCGTSQGRSAIAELPEEPCCVTCGSGLLVPCFWGSERVRELLEKRREHRLSEEERTELARARRSADLVLAYGRKAVVALSVYGIGPQTASRILAEMHDDEQEFYRSLLEAKLKFVTTRQFWRD